MVLGGRCVNIAVAAALPALGSDLARALHALARYGRDAARARRTGHDRRLLSSSDPLANSVNFLLSAYQAETDKLDVRYADPDRHPAEFLALQQKYGIEAGRTEDGSGRGRRGHVMSRAGGKPFFLSAANLVDVAEGTRAGALQDGARVHAHAAARLEQRAPARSALPPGTARSGSTTAARAASASFRRA